MVRCDPERWVEEYGDYLMGFAVLRVRDHAVAEDLVQETFLAALKARASFEGKSAEKTWLAGILKNKILDHFRKAGRQTSFTDLRFYDHEDRESFIPDGPLKDCWLHERGPIEWNTAGAGLDAAQFWKTFHECLSKVPDKVAQVFLLRELDDIPTNEICTTLNITPNNLWVMLHRARMALRRCLETNGFGKDAQE